MEPQPVSDEDVMFPGTVAHLMVPYAQIPDEFKRDRHPCVKIIEEWFYNGIKGGVDTWVAADGIDRALAIRHLKCIMRSFSPKHEHKTACVAYLLSIWFDEITVGKIVWKRS
jgi:hypothetical protein